MNYDEFTRCFLVTLRDSGLRPLLPEERIDLRSGSRMFSIGVEPLDEEVGKPFHVVASISFEWSALQAARSATCEEDLLAQLLGDDEGVETERPFLRVDIKLQAGLPWGKGIPMPAATVWAKWSREALARLEDIEPLISEDAVRETPEGRLAILAWQGDPEAKITCNPLGELRLESLTVRAFQGIDLPRKWDDPEREPDEAPHAQLRAMFERVRAALYAWGEVMDHFRPGGQV